jgi:hypothetical protein
MKKKVSICFFALLLIVFDGFVFSQSLDQSYTDLCLNHPDSGDCGGTWTGSGQLGAQTYTAGLTGSLTSVAMFLNVSSPNGPGSIVVKITNVESSGEPGPVTYGTVSVDSTMIDNFHWNTIHFGSPVYQVAGRQYAIVIAAPTTFLSWHAGIFDAYHSSSTYTGGSGWSYADGSQCSPSCAAQWTPSGSNWDYGFITYVDTSITPPPDIDSYTPVGNNVSVEPIDSSTNTMPVVLTFSSVSQQGDTSVASSSQGNIAPFAFKTGTPPVYYDLSTNAIYSGVINLCFSWTEGQFSNESTIKLFHYENNVWTNVTSSLDTTKNKVCGQVSSLSPFALFESAFSYSGFFPPVDNPPVTNSAKAGVGIPVKFSLGGYFGLDIMRSVSQQVLCDSYAPVDAITETVTAGGSTLSYDPSTS